MDSVTSESWLLCLILSVPLISIAALARIEQGSWYAPGAFFALVWTVLVCLPLLLAPDMDVWPFALVAITIAVGVFYVGSIVGMGGLGRGRVSSRSKQSRNSVIDGTHGTQWGTPAVVLPGLTGLTILGSVSGVTGVFVLLTSGGFGVADLFSLESLATLARAFSIARYQYDYSPPALVRFLMMLLYAGGLFGGALYAYARDSRKKWIGLLPFLPAVGFMAVLTTRTSVLYELLVWCSAYLTMTALMSGRRKALFTKSFGMKALVGIPLAVLVSSLVLVARYGEDLSAFYALIWPRVRGDIVGHLPAFGEWLRDFLNERQIPTYGAYTFAGLFEALGIRPRSMGMYEESVLVGQGDFAFETNIYTVFRGFAEDFSIPGSLVLLLLLGIGSGRAYRAVVSGNVAVAPFLAIFYGFALWNHIVSFTAYNTLILAYAVFVVYALAIGLQMPVLRSKPR